MSEAVLVMALLLGPAAPGDEAIQTNHVEEVTVYPARKHLLRVKAEGGGEILVEGLVSWDGEPARELEATTPLRLKREARTLCARFRSLDPERSIRVELRKPSEKRFGTVARSNGRVIELSWAKAGHGRRSIDGRAEWEAPLSCLPGQRVESERQPAPETEGSRDDASP